MFNNNSTHENETIRKCLLNNESGFERINFTFECFKYKLQSDFKFSILTCLFLLIIALDIILNLIVLTSILIEKCKKRVDICFMSNAFADLIMGMVIMPFTALYTLFGHFPFGPYVCFLWNCLDFTAGTTSMLHLTLISFDRYLSVSKPLKYTKKQKTENRFSVTGIPTSLILIFIWFFSCAAWVPVLLYFKSNNQEINTDFFLKLKSFQSINETLMKQESKTSYLSLNNDNNDCYIDGSPKIIFPHSFIVYYLPMFLIFYFYTKTIKIVNDKMKRRKFSNLALRKKKLLVKKSIGFLILDKCCVKTKAKEQVVLNIPIRIEINGNESTSVTVTNLAKSSISLRKCSLLSENNFVKKPVWSSLENNLNKSLENSKHLNKLYVLKKSHIRTYSSWSDLRKNSEEPKSQSSNEASQLKIDPESNTGSRSGILKKLASNSSSPNLTNKSLSFKLNKNSSFRLNAASKSLSNSSCALSKKERNVTYKLGFIMFTFLFSWFPFCILWPLISFCNKSDLCSVPENFYIFSFWLAYLNSIFTPLILVYNNNKYRKSITILKKLICSNPFTSLNMNSLNQNTKNRAKFEYGPKSKLNSQNPERSLVFRRSSFNV